MDVLHASTMVGLALVDRGARRVALADTGVELALATAGASPADLITSLTGKGKPGSAWPTRACFAPDAKVRGYVCWRSTS